MDLTHFVLYIHILGWVFWLGTDLGVFIGAKFTENPKYSVETRLTILKLAMILDIAPRVAVPVVFATGVFLMNVRYGVAFPSTGVGAAIGAVWLAVVVLGVVNEETTRLGALAKRGVLMIQGLAVIGMGGAGLYSLFGGDLFPLWLAGKWLAYAWIALFAIAIDVTFKPAIADYVKLQVEGASDQVNASLSKNLKPVYATVLAVYAGTMVAAYLGVAKPF